VTSFDELDARRFARPGLNFPGEPAFRFAKLQRGQTFTVNGHVDKRRIGVESLAKHQDGFFVSVAAAGRKLNVSGDGTIAFDLAINEMKIVFGEPHVLTPAADA